MKKISTKNLLSFFVLIFIFGCNNKVEQINYFSSTSDTLYIRTEKIKGVGMFPPGAGTIQFVDTSEFKDFTIIYPDSISDIKIGFNVIDFKAWIFNQYKKGESELSYIKNYIENNKIDTLKVPSFADNSLCIISGKKEGKKIFIVDQNNNKNFKDDTIREVHKLDWWSKKDLIKCTYKIYDGEKIINDTTWVNVGYTYGDNLLFFVSQHMVANIKIDESNYELGIVSDVNNFCYDNPLIALLSDEQIKKDTIIVSDLLSTGEYLGLGQNYYSIHNISNNGKILTLVKEDNFFNKIGTQVGMIAPEFEFVSFSGDTLNSSDFENKKILIVNISGCTPDSYNDYKDLLNELEGNIEIIGIESTLKESLGGTMLDVENEFNKKIFEDYRNSKYSSYECFLINQEGRIIDKFNIFQWKGYLSNYTD